MDGTTGVRRVRDVGASEREAIFNLLRSIRRFAGGCHQHCPMQSDDALTAISISDP
ncbi:MULTISPECIES: hypothetical protein [unclassified Sphingobium]|uniref:hypothetical protein n=1 Tax=unclassified Sphingobium TaxID=2611147 RepID=UPI00130545C1|nr:MULTISPECIES: hypothetical protein [unclassified Sphingobium]